MKIISKFISFFLIVVAVSACNTKEIDNPDNQNPDKSLVSDIKLTANITQTRVNYSVNGGLLTQCWAEGDVIYGYYGSVTGSKVILTVEEVVDGIATLKPESGYEGFVAALKNQIKTQEDKILPFGLVYTGVDASDEDVLFTEKGKIDVLLSNQDIGQIPACLQSVAYKIIPGKSEEKIVQFIFSNECAILEIESLTGIAEYAKITEGNFMELSSIKVSGSEDCPLYNHIEFSYDGMLHSSSGSSDYYNPFVAVSSTTERPLRVDDKGNIVDGQGNKSCIRIAVYPQGDVILNVTATPSDDEEHPFISEYKGTLSPGNCYIISSKDVVAKTEDGLYFTSVSGAFAHAAVLSGQGYTTAEDNVVTLIKKEIAGLGEQTASPAHNEQIEIDYPVTLDLNGCTLSLDAEGFDVDVNGKFTISDSSISGSGKISGTVTDIVTNNGTTYIEGGTLWQTAANMCAVFSRDSGNLIVNGGTLYSERCSALFSYGTTIINDGDISSRDDAAIYDYGSITVKDGKIHTNTLSAILAGGYEVIIGDESGVGSLDISSSYSGNYGNKSSSVQDKLDSPAILVNPDSETLKEMDKENATFTMYSGIIEGEKSAVTLLGSIQATISGGILDSKEQTLNVLDGASCIISGGQLYSSNTEDPTIFCGCADSNITGTNMTIMNGTTQGEPLIYSLAKIGDIQGAVRSDAPVCAVYNQGQNYATVNICGGYLYSSSGYFYLENDATELNNGNSIFDPTGAKAFYSNCNAMGYYDSHDASQYNLNSFNITVEEPDQAPSFSYDYLINSEVYNKPGAITFGYKMTKTQ